VELGEAKIHQHRQNGKPSIGFRGRFSRRQIWIALATSALAVTVNLAAALIAVAAGEPVAEVRATIDEATPAFANSAISPAERQQRLPEIAMRHFDFAYMTRSAMGTHWKSLNPAQRKELVPLFSDHVMGTYLATLKQSTVEAAGHGLNDKVTYDGADRATVYSDVRLPSLAEPLAVNYSLRKAADGWKLCDIVVDNVSTMANYRDEFNKTMNEGGYAKLVSQLRTRQPAQARL
jgi:phospholipid transport system substrate-binding protein